MAIINVVRPLEGLITFLFLSALAKAEREFVFERRAALVTSEVGPDELAGASSGARTEGEPKVLFSEVKLSSIGSTGGGTTESGATEGDVVGILNLVNLIFTKFNIH